MKGALCLLLVFFLSAANAESSPCLEGAHVYEETILPAACWQQGYTLHTCTLCQESFRDHFTPSLSHWYGPWSPDPDASTHSAACKREGCRKILTIPCQETAMGACPVCGRFQAENWSPLPQAQVHALTRQGLPQGELAVFSSESPQNGALYAFTAVFEFAGQAEAMTGRVCLEIPWPDEAEEPLQLLHIAFDTNGTERRTPLTFSRQEGRLVFETEVAGLFQILPLQPGGASAPGGFSQPVQYAMYPQ